MAAPIYPFIAVKFLQRFRVQTLVCPAAQGEDKLKLEL
jgi:hypothetical protein